MLPLLIMTLAVGLGVGAIAALRPRGATGPPDAARAHTQGPATAPATAGLLGAAGIYSRLKPSVVDVMATLRRDGEIAAGTGFVVDAGRGFVLTNNHVIRNATSVMVRLAATGRSYPARVVGANAGADIAVLQLQGAAGLTAAPLAGSAAVTVGTPVLAIGNQAGQDRAPATAPGVVDGLNRTIRAADGLAGVTETLHGMLQTSARIVPGDSGGPLAGPAGTVIGVDTASGTGGSPAGYAIPIGAAMALERQITARSPASPAPA